jgi:WD40 repeat protein
MRRYTSRYRWGLLGLAFLIGILWFMLDRSDRISVRSLHIAFRPDGRALAAATDEGVQIWNIPERQILQSLDVGGHSLVAWSPNGQVLATNGPNYTIHIWRIADSTLVASLSGPTAAMDSIAFSPDGQLLAAGSRDFKLRVWRLPDGALVHTFQHPYIVISVAFSPDGQLLASGGPGINLWRVSDGMPISWTANLPGGDVPSVTFSPDGQLLASGDSDGNITIRRVVNGSLLHTIKAHNGAVTSIAFSPDGQYLASGVGLNRRSQRIEETVVRLWNVRDGSLMKTFTGHREIIETVVFSPDGHTLASSSLDGIRFWRVS